MSPQMIVPALLTALLVISPLDARQVTPTPPEAEARILGTVLDENEIPVVGALVMLGDGRSTETDLNGRFSFYRVRPGAHEIAAVAPTCAMAAGGFNAPSGSDTRLQLIVERQAEAERVATRSRGTSTRVMDRDELRELGNRTGLDAVIQLAPSDFEVEGPQLALRTRRGAASIQIIEPLLLLDGVKVPGRVAESLRGLKANDLARVEVHMGTAAGWEFQIGGAPAVVEVTTRMTVDDPVKDPSICLSPDAR